MTSPTAKKTTKKVTKKKTAKKVAKKTAKKTSKKTTKASLSKKEIVKVSSEVKISNTMKQFKIVANDINTSVDALANHMNGCAHDMMEAGGVMAMTNSLKELLPVGDVQALDFLYKLNEKFFENDFKTKTALNKAKLALEATPQWERVKNLKDSKDISSAMGKVLLNMVNANASYLDENFQMRVTTPLGKELLIKRSHSFKVNDVEKVPNEYKTAKIVLKNSVDAEKVQKILEENGIELEKVEYVVSSAQKNAMKSIEVEGEKRHFEYMSATEEERETEGLKDFNAEEEGIKGTATICSITAIKTFSDNKF